MKNNYLTQIQNSMHRISKNNNAVFIGQTVSNPGSLIFSSLSKVSKDKRIELPLFEETQMGMAIGLSLSGFIPVCCYPRFDFFILALNQTVNHLDKINKISSYQHSPFVITRVLVGSKKPIYAGLQHSQNHTGALRLMLKFTEIVELKNPKIIYKEYQKALTQRKSKIFIEYSQYY
jgi:pyruvate/2-oxoglutarate/acetoin dehydrogenase E1 component